jgi:hypothetical protein
LATGWVVGATADGTGDGSKVGSGLVEASAVVEGTGMTAFGGVRSTGNRAIPDPTAITPPTAPTARTAATRSAGRRFQPADPARRAVAGIRLTAPRSGSGAVTPSSISSL